jgi:hypothetical protein
MTKIIKHMVIPIFIIGISFVLFTSCKSSDDDYNPSATDNSLPSDASTDAQFVQAYKDAGYSTFKNTCAAASSGYGLSYLFLKQSADASYDYDGVQLNFTKTDCDETVSHSLVVQENSFWVDLVTDTSADTSKPASAAIGKGMNLYVTDVKITPNSQTIVDKFKAVSNASSYTYSQYSGTTTPGTGTIAISATRYAATGFCGTTDWNVGISKNVNLPGDDTSTDSTVIGLNSKDIGLLSASGLTDCALPPRGDVSAFYFDVGGPGTSAGLTGKGIMNDGATAAIGAGNGSALNGVSGSDGKADVLNIQLFLKKGIALSNDASADAVNTIWLTSSQNTGVGSVTANNSMHTTYAGAAGEIETVYSTANDVFLQVQDAFYLSTNKTYPFDYITTGSGAYYRED